MFKESRALAQRRDPWFVLHPLRAKVVVAVSFIAVFALHLAVGTADAAVLYVLPVALAALGFGLLVGTVAGLVAIGLIAVGVLFTDESLAVVSW